MKRKLSELLSLLLAVMMILSSVAAFAEEETTEPSGKFFVYLGNENIESATDLSSNSISQDIIFDKSFAEQNLLKGSDDGLLGWNIWSSNSSDGTLTSVNEMIKKVDKFYKLTSNEYASLATDGSIPTLAPVYVTDDDTFTLHFYNGTDEIVADADFDSSKYTDITGYYFLNQFAEQIQQALGLNILEELNSRVWRIENGKYVDYIELGDSDFFTYSQYLAGYVYIEPVTTDKAKIVFDANGAEGEMADVTVDKGSKYDLPYCKFTTPEGKYFAGWEINGTTYNPYTQITVDSNIIIKATWKAIPGDDKEEDDEEVEEDKLKISFDANGGSGSMKYVYVDKYEEYELPECKYDAPEDMVFDCWEINDKTYDPEDVIEIKKDTVIKALWRKEGIVATPEFTPDGGKFTSSGLDISITCDTPRATIYYTLNGEDPRDSSKRKKYEGNVYIKADTTILAYAVKDGMEDSEVARAFFDKRATAGSSSGGSSSGGSSYGGTTTRSYTIKFNTKGGLTVPDQYISRNKTVKEPDKVTKYGYTFEGWYTDDKYTQKYDFSTPVAKSFTLYAKWTEEGNTVTNESSDEASDNKIILTINQYKMIKFGESIVMDVVPQIVNDRTMLPARHVAEALGAVVEWNENEPKKVRITKDSTEIILYIDSDTAYLNGEAVTLDSAPFLENDRTYTPVRFICENLGATVDWEEGEQKVIIYAER